MNGPLRVALLSALTVVAACERRPSDESEAKAGTSAVSSPAAEAPRPRGGASGEAPAEGIAGAAPAAGGVANAPAPSNEAETGPLEGESPERNPGSETVTLKLTVLPAVAAELMWGAKRLGKVEAGKPLALQRPRASGPLDVIVRAPGFLPFHTRLFSDRDDKVTVRLVRPEGASGLFGYKRTAAAPTAAGTP